MNPAMTMWRGRPRPRVVVIQMCVSQILMRFRRPAILPKKRHEPQPEHIKGSEKCGEQSNKPVDPTRLISPPQDFVLAEETSKRRNPGDGEGRDGHGPERPWNLRAQPAHLTHVL